MPVAAITTSPDCEKIPKYYSECACKHKRGFAKRPDMGQVSGCKVTTDVSLGGFDLPAQSVIAAQEFDGHFEQVGYFMR
jgi:hypothetical protein